MWQVSKVVEEHNHELHPSMSRTISRRLNIGAGDADCINSMFLRMYQKNNDFFHLIRMDDEGRLDSVFWVQHRSKVAYEELNYVCIPLEVRMPTFIVVVKTSIEDSLVGSIVSSEEDAFKLYNDHRHFMCSHRRVTKNNAGYLQKLKDNGVSITAGLRVSKKQSMGDKYPITLMADQSAATAASLYAVVPSFPYESAYFYEGSVEMMVTESRLLKHANEVYTIGTYGSSVGDVGKVSKKDIAGYSACRREIELNINAWKYAEEGFRMMKDKIAYEVGPYYVDNSENEVKENHCPLRSSQGRCPLTPYPDRPAGPPFSSGDFAPKSPQGQDFGGKLLEMKTYLY
ncbi:hypothetical protein M9H77_30542 [Catharanthus roseus]|uniref:Uncharacterized protein n=1 Tax=Catharanthus roseus TaxID=4058 RepID=A0ACB9ZYL5_CATRO|nr:hypothetical protein M9H77_30542 [Catharanthus roseus]